MNIYYRAAKNTPLSRLPLVSSDASTILWIARGEPGNRTLQ